MGFEWVVFLVTDRLPIQAKGPFAQASLLIELLRLVFLIVEEIHQCCRQSLVDSFS